MGLDGFSMSNLGLHRDLTSAQMASQAEQIVQKELQSNQVVGQLSKKQKVERKKQKDENDETEFQDVYYQQEEEEEEDKQPLKEEKPDIIKSAEEGAKAFSVRVNESEHVVELYDEDKEKLLSKMSPEDLVGLISKLDSASGVLVNRKI